MAVYFSVSPVRSFVFFFFHFSIFLLRVTLLHVWFGRCVSFRRQYYVNGAITLATVQTNSNGYDFLFLTLANGLYLLCMHLLHVQSKALLFRRVFFLSLSLSSRCLYIQFLFKRQQQRQQHEKYNASIWFGLLVFFAAAFFISLRTVVNIEKLRLRKMNSTRFCSNSHNIVVLRWT